MCAPLEESAPQYLYSTNFPRAAVQDVGKRLIKSPAYPADSIVLPGIQAVFQQIFPLRFVIRVFPLVSKTCEFSPLNMLSKGLSETLNGARTNGMREDEETWAG